MNRRNLGRSVMLFKKKKREDIEAAFPTVFTDKEQTEFDLKYGVQTNTKPPTTTTAVNKTVPAKARDNSVPIAK